MCSLCSFVAFHVKERFLTFFYFSVSRCRNFMKCQTTSDGSRPFLWEPASNFVHFSLKISQLVATTLMISAENQLTKFREVFHPHGYCRSDVRRRIIFASSVMSSLDCIWKEHRLPLSIKIRVYLALVQSGLLYASGTWTLTSTDAKSLKAFHMKCQQQCVLRWVLLMLQH